MYGYEFRHHDEIIRNNGPLPIYPGVESGVESRHVRSKYSRRGKEPASRGKARDPSLRVPSVPEHAEGT